MAVVFLGLGSNMGDRKANILTALDLCFAQGMRMIKTSRLIETDPVGGPLQRKFFNAAACVETDLPPHDLLAFCKRIEKDMGRTSDGKNTPRPIDIDILLYNNDRIVTPTLTIPHPRMWERDFVMRPLREIVPGIDRKQYL